MKNSMHAGEFSFIEDAINPLRFIDRSVQETVPSNCRKNFRGGAEKFLNLLCLKNA